MKCHHHGVFLAGGLAASGSTFTVVGFVGTLTGWVLSSSGSCSCLALFLLDLSSLRLFRPVLAMRGACLLSSTALYAHVLSG